MTLGEFRRDKQLVGWAIALFQTQQWQLLREALRESHPKNFRQQGDHLGDNAHHKLGRIYGYDEFDSNLESAAIFDNTLYDVVSSTFKPD